MIEALEALKTYISDKNCIFVVACDDDVVRSVVGKSDKVSVNGASDTALVGIQRQPGEDYLDKFFQQTFRLPAYMEIDLFDFAEEHFSSTQLYNTLEAEDVSTRYLLSVILPANVISPRKVKRLLNEFIATYEVASRRESESGKLRPKALTSAPEFLGKISTIRAEFPGFYKKLVGRPELLNNVTELIRKQEIEEARKELEGCVGEAKLDSLLGYLQKTQIVTVSEIEPYLWMSQDTLARDLNLEQSRKLRISLSNGSAEEVIEMLTSATDDSERSLLAQVASRYVEFRLKGVEQLNGTIVLSRIIDYLDIQIKGEVAQVAAKLIPQLRLDGFVADDVLRVLQWAKRGENKKLISSVMERLDDENFREETFGAILDFWKVIDCHGITPEIQEWLRNLLSPEMQVEQPNQEFALWLVEQVSEYDGEQEVVERYFAHELTDYIANRLVGKYADLPAIDLDTEEGQLFRDALATIGRYSEQDGTTKFWDAVSILLESASRKEYEYGSELLKDHLETVPTDNADQLVETMASGLIGIVGDVRDDLTQWVAGELAVVEKLCETKETSLEDDASERFEDLLLKLGAYQNLNETIIGFADGFISKFDDENGKAAIRGICNIFSKGDSGVEGDRAYLEIVIKYEQRLDDTLRNRIVDAIDRCARSNDLSHIGRAQVFVEQLAAVDSFKEVMKQIAFKWVELINPGNVQLLKAKTDLALASFSAGFVASEALAEKLTNLLPFNGDQPQLEIAIEALKYISDSISDSVGLVVFQRLLPHFGHYGPLLQRALVLMSPWCHLADENQQSQYISIVLQRFNTWPVEMTKILPVLWSSMSDVQVQQQLILMYQQNQGADYRRLRDSAAQTGLASLRDEDKTRIVWEVWENLQASDNVAEQFMAVAYNKLSLEEINGLRADTIDQVRELGAAPPAESNLRLLAVTAHRDIKEVMPIVLLFENLFGRGEAEVTLATKYVLHCLKPLPLRSSHKHKLAPAMSRAVSRYENQSGDIHEAAEKLGLKGNFFGGWAYKKYWA